MAHRLEFLIYNRSLSNAAWHYKSIGRKSDWQRFSMETEMARQVPAPLPCPPCPARVPSLLTPFSSVAPLQGIRHDGEPEDGFLDKWVLCDLNGAYDLAATYPSKFFAPRIVNADTIKGSAAFRSKGRLPALTWYANRSDGIRSIVR